MTKRYFQICLSVLLDEIISVFFEKTAKVRRHFSKSSYRYSSHETEKSSGMMKPEKLRKEIPIVYSISLKSDICWIQLSLSLCVKYSVYQESIVIVRE